MLQSSIPSRSTFGVALVLLACLVSFGAWTPQDKAPSLNSKDANNRLAAAKALVETGDDNLQKVMHKLLKDNDWEVSLVAIRALGDCGDKKDVESLIRIATTSPILELRAEAALSLGKLDAPKAADSLSGKLRKDATLFACEALIRIAPQVPKFEEQKALTRLDDHESSEVRSAAAGALVALARSDRGLVMRKVLSSEFLAVRARALEVAKEQPHADLATPIYELLQRPQLNDVVLRRAIGAYVASVASMPEGSQAAWSEALKSLGSSDDPAVARRAALLAEALANSETATGLDLIATTSAVRKHADAGVRAGAARSLRSMSGGDALAAALAMFDGESSDRVRLAAAHAIFKLQPVSEEAGSHWAVEQLSLVSDRKLRQAIAVELGNKDLEENVAVGEALIAALDDSDWGVSACAAVSLGLTRSSAGTAALIKMATDQKDWRRRGAAVVGLTKALRKEGITTIIAALGDSEPLVKQTALSYLNTLRRGEPLTANSTEWGPWWAEIQEKMRLYDPREQLERNEKYGYVTDPKIIYRGLDVMVLDSRGDHIQHILARLDIQHRMTQASKVVQDGLDAGGVFVSNCTGEMEKADLERLSWFVKVGGYVTGSCWALSMTINHLEPGVVAKLHTKDEVMDNVIATPCDIESQYTEGVFGKYVFPVYRLEGAHLIDILEPERVEMLVDSVDCAERWGGGNLACWFRSGHGTLLDSANHFDSPVFQHAQGLKKPEQRMAYAINHMGTSYAQIRETAKEKFWASNGKAAKEIFDDSVFRLVTNFVRLRRLEGR